MPFLASQAVFRSLSSQLSKTLFTRRPLDQLSFLMPNYSFRSSGMRRKQNLEFPSPSSFTFRFLSSPLLSLFFPRFSPFVVGHSLCFLSVGKGFAKTPGWWNCLEGSTSGSRWTRFSLEFSGQSYYYLGFCIFLWPVWPNRAHLSMAWKISVLAQVSCQSCLGPLKLMTSQVVQGTWLNKGGCGRFRGECVKSTLSPIPPPFNHLFA